MTAAGRLYAVLGDPERPGAVTHRPDATTAREIETRGYALNRDAWIDGLAVLGVPIWQDGGRDGSELVAVLALAAASPRFDVLGETRIAERLLQAARDVSDRLSARAGSRRPARGMKGGAS